MLGTMWYLAWPDFMRLQTSCARSSGWASIHGVASVSTLQASAFSMSKDKQVVELHTWRTPRTRNPAEAV